MDQLDSQLIKAVLRGETECFEALVRKYQPRVFAMARRYARRESEVEDIVQEVFLKGFQKLATFRGDAPFEHWLMRLGTRTCYDYLRKQQRNREMALAELTEEEESWMERFAAAPESTNDQSTAAKALIAKLMESLKPEAQMVITLMEIEEKSVKEVAELTGWSESKVKVRAFRARNEMRKVLQRISPEKFL
jgi:RNA polymerase sigma-70 factor, ECF subfamily